MNTSNKKIKHFFHFSKIPFVVPVGPHTFTYNTPENKLKPVAGLMDEACVRWGLKTVMAASLN